MITKFRYERKNEMDPVLEVDSISANGLLKCSNYKTRNTETFRRLQKTSSIRR